MADEKKTPDLLDQILTWLTDHWNWVLERIGDPALSRQMMLDLGLNPDTDAVPGPIAQAAGTDTLDQLTDLYRTIEVFADAVRSEDDSARDVAWLACVPARDAGVPLDAHAGRVETSLMLALAPHLVRTGAAAAGATAPLRELIDGMRAGGVAAVSPNGVLGDPAGASAEEGAELPFTFAGEPRGELPDHAPAELAGPNEG